MTTRTPAIVFTVIFLLALGFVGSVRGGTIHHLTWDKTCATLNSGQPVRTEASLHDYNRACSRPTD